MNSVYCRGCGAQIHETAPTCPHCGAPQMPMATATKPSTGSSWMAWVALACGVIPAMAVFADQSWTRESFEGGVVLAVIDLLFSGVSLARGRAGKGIAIAALILGVFGLLISAGHLS